MSSHGPYQKEEKYHLLTDHLNNLTSNVDLQDYLKATVHHVHGYKLQTTDLQQTKIELLC